MPARYEVHFQSDTEEFSAHIMDQKGRLSTAFATAMDVPTIVASVFSHGAGRFLGDQYGMMSADEITFAKSARDQIKHIVRRA